MALLGGVFFLFMDFFFLLGAVEAYDGPFGKYLRVFYLGGSYSILDSLFLAGTLLITRS